MRMLTLPVALAVLLAGFLPAAAEDWKPAPGRLTTRWAKEVSPENAHPEYPRPQMVRPKWKSLNGLWQLTVAEPEAKPPVGEDLSKRILVPFPIESALSGVMRAAEWVWYRRTFEVSEEWSGQRVLLHFQAVDWQAEVFVNGKELGMHRGGYDAFTLDVTDALKAEGPQELIVRVFDPTSHGDQPRGKQVDKPGGIWYTPTTGIWQTVWLEAVPAVRVGRLMLVPDVDASCLRLTAQGIGTTEEHAVEAAARLGQEEVARATGRVGEEIEIAIPKEKLSLWSPDEPTLYELTVRLTHSGVTVDQVESYFGMRKVDLGKDDKGRTRIRLNNEPLFLVGPLDQGFWPDGIYTAPTDEALRYDIEVTKQLGFNATRKHVKIEPDRWYYWCDKLGLLVFQDMPNGNNKTPEAKQQFERELRPLVEGRRNHPAIVTWVVFNEGWGQHDTERYVEMVERMDPTRLIVCASGWSDVPGLGDIHDIHKYPGPAAPEPEESRASVLGEFGGLGLGVDGHTWADKTWGYRGTASREDLTRRYVDLLTRLAELRESPGLSAAIYTQITDVETECNGLMTYDRAMIKVDVKQVAAANQGKVPKRNVIVPAARNKPMAWRYTFEQPPEGWQQPGFDDSSWKEGPAGFGEKTTPGAVVRTEWKTPEIWIRRQFELPEVSTENLLLLIHHDEDAEVYIDGVPAAKTTEFTTGYETVPIAPAALETLKRAGKHTFAVHCKQTKGGQYIDVGLVEVVMEDE